MHHVIPAPSADLLARYDRPGPRYTSYPTAVEFHPGVNAEAYGAALARADAHPDAPLSLYVHLPFCEERCAYCGCNVVITKHREVADRYLGYLEREIRLLAAHLPARRVVSQLHWGGGTPTYYTSSQLVSVFAQLSEVFTFTPQAEIALEVDPRVTSAEQLSKLRALGFNRVSMGVQDFDPQVQEAVNRVQSYELTRDLVDHARAVGYGSINIDLIYGLPYQTPERFARTLEQVLVLRPERVAAYSFAFVPWMKAHMKHLPEDSLPGPGVKLALLALTQRAFAAAGYTQIGMDHFALPEDELARAVDGRSLHRNFMGYTVQSARDMVALGVSGIGDVQGVFVQNTKKLSEYYELLDAGQFPIERGYALDEDDLVRRHVITELMCNGHLDIGALERRFDLRFADYFAAELHELTRAGLGRGRRSRRHQPGRARGDAAGADVRAQHLHDVRPLSAGAAHWRHAGLQPHGMTGPRVTVVGAGISGLALAFTLQEDARRRRQPLQLRVVDGAAQAGGHVQSRRVDGFLVEAGPNGFLNREPHTLDLVEALGLGARLVEARPEAKRRFILREGRLCEVPGGPGSLLTSPALTWRGKLRLLSEPFAPAPPADQDETVHAFATRRIGREAADMLVDTAVSGISAGDSRRLSVSAQFPVLSEMERDHGSLLRAMFARRGTGRGPSKLLSFEGGLATLTAALVERLGSCLQTGTAVRGLTRAHGAWRVILQDGLSHDADHVVLALPARAAATVVQSLDGALAAGMRGIEYSSLAVVALGYATADVQRPLDGYGYLVTRPEGLATLGVVWESSLFPGRAADGTVLLRVFLGGARRPAVMGATDAALAALARLELAPVLGVTADPRHLSVFRWPEAIAQYTVGHDRRRDAIYDRVATHPGLSVCGTSYEGVSFNHAVKSGRQAALLLTDRLWGQVGTTAESPAMTGTMA